MSMFVRTSITTRSRNQAGRLIRGISAAAEKAALQVASDVTDDVIDDMKIYPAPIPGSKYVRTYLFQRSWKKTKVKTVTGQGYQITNMAARKGRKYGGYVVGDAKGEGQATIHMGRWRVFRDVLETLWVAARTLIYQKIKQYIERGRFS